MEDGETGGSSVPAVTVNPLWRIYCLQCEVWGRSIVRPVSGTTDDQFFSEYVRIPRWMTVSCRRHSSSQWHDRSLTAALRVGSCIAVMAISSPSHETSSSRGSTTLEKVPTTTICCQDPLDRSGKPSRVHCGACEGGALISLSWGTPPV